MTESLFAISPRSFRAVPGIAAIGLVIACSIVALPLHAQQRANVEFDAAFLPGDTAMTIDLSRFSRGNPVMPGVYDADIRLNGEWQDRRSVRFLVAPGRDADDAFPCISAQDLAAFGVDVETGSPDLGACMPVGERIPDATVHFDVGEQRLDIDVPQSMLVRRHRAGAPVDQWDHGRASAQLGWRADVHRASGTHHRALRYVAADAGANVGAWRLREAGAWSGARYRRRHLYMERSMPVAHAHLRLGEFVLADDIFASRRFVGLSVSTDRRMFDDAGSGDAPVVRGVAHARARVRVMEGDRIVRELFVPRGSFIIDDLGGSASGRDMVVLVDDDEGRHTSFRVPFYPMPERLRRGRSSYALAMGRTSSSAGGTGMTQAAWRHGITDTTTVYAGARLTPAAASSLVGGATNAWRGAVAVDVMQTRANGSMSGRRWRARYGRRWRGNTTVSASFSRVSERATRDTATTITRFDTMLQHALAGDRGVLGWQVGYASFAGRSREVTHALSWNRSFGRASVDVSGRSATRPVAGRYSGRDLAAQFNLSVPLGIPASPTLTSAMAMDEHGYARMQSGLTGRFGGELSYAASVARRRSGGRQVGMALTRLFQGGEGTLSVEHAGASRSTAASASGALVWHEGGITGTRRLGESMALLHAPGAAGARVTSSAGTRFDRRGFAVLPFLAPYRWNVIDVDPAGLSFDVTLETSRRRVAPTSGALVRVVFETDVGRTVLMTVKRAGGLAVPFGAEVADPEGRALGIVGQGGAVFVRGAQATVPLTVRWAGEHAGSCTLRMSEQAAVAEGLRRQTEICE